jgi:hypothetical protein
MRSSQQLVATDGNGFRLISRFSERFATGCHRLQPRGSIDPSLSCLATFDGATALLPAAAGSVNFVAARRSYAD